MILDLNKSTYYYNSGLFEEGNKKILFQNNLKKEKSDFWERWKSTEFIDLNSKLTKDIIYVKAPLATKQLSEESYDSLSAIYQELDKYFDEIPLSKWEHEEEPEFDHYILIHWFHGLNRTGSIICTYLMHKLGIEMNEVIEMFEKARLHRFEYKFINEALQTFS